MSQPATIYEVHPGQFTLKQVAETAWKFAEEKYREEALHEKPRITEVQQALMWAQVSKIFDLFGKDREGFLQAMKNLRTKGKIYP